MKRMMAWVLTVVLLVGLALPASAAQAEPGDAAQPDAASGKKMVALTFDDGPGAYTDRLLDALRDRGVKVTFFMVGSNVKRYPETVKRVYTEGHQLANHTYDHADLTDLNTDAVKAEIQKTNDLLDLACGKGASYLVRAPYGNTNERVREAVGAPLIYWSVDPQDWKYRNAETVKNNIISAAQDGSIILVHDIHSTSVDGAIAAIDILLSRGYEFVTVRELFRRRGTELKNGTTYYKCSPNGTDLGPVAKPEIATETVDGKLRLTLWAQSGAKIYYSLDGSPINQNSPVYTGPITVSLPCKVRAVAAFQLNGSRSEPLEQSFTKLPIQPPKIQIENGVMTLINRTPGAALYYTLDGTTATPEATRYEGPVTLERGTVVSACAGGGDYLTSPAVRATYSDLGHVFADVFPQDWYYADIDQAVAAGYLLGVGDNRYAPNKNLSRGQLVTLLYRYSGERVEQQDLDNLPFSDVAGDKFYTAPVAWAYAHGIVQGYDAKTFKPNRDISRQELCKVLAAFLTYRGMELPEGTDTAGRYSDENRIADWARESVEQMTALGLLKGNADGTFHPGGPATRAQAAAILMRLSKLEALEEPELWFPQSVAFLISHISVFC